MSLATIGSRSRPRLLALGLLLAAMFAVSACQADFEVLVTVEDDGSGIVETKTTLDAEASAALLDLERDSTGLPLADLAQSGWAVDRPEQAANGSTVFVATKEFGTTSQFTEVMSELTGDAGAFRNFRLVRTKTFARVDYELEGTIDTTDGLEGFSDAELDRALGESLTSIAEGYGATADDVAFRFEAVLPGEVQGDAVADAVEVDPDEPRATWVATLARPEVQSIALSSATRQVSALVLRGVAVVAGVLAGLVVFAQSLRIVLPDRRRRAGRKRPPDRRRPPDVPVTTPPAVVDAESAAERRLDVHPHKVVALDGMGVLYRQGEDSARLLISFARDRASRVTDDDIVAKARLLELGRITSGTFWTSIGVDGDPKTLDTEYLAQLQLTPGVVKYLRSLRDKGIRVACITNDSAEWAARLRAGHTLDGLIDPWVVSGTVGVRKPDLAIFEVLRRVTGEPASAILVVDDDLDTLDVAAELGFATAWFSADGDRELARDHPIIRNFDVIAGNLENADTT